MRSLIESSSSALISSTLWSFEFFPRIVLLLPRSFRLLTEIGFAFFLVLLTLATALLLVVLVASPSEVAVVFTEVVVALSAGCVVVFSFHLEVVLKFSKI